MSYLDLLTDFIEQPKRAARAASAERPIGLGALSFLFAGVSLFLAQSISGRTMLSAGIISLLLVCAWRLFGGMLMAAVLHLLVDLSGPRERPEGNAAGLWVLLGLCDLVLALALPGALILRLLGLDRAMTLLLLVLGLAQVILKVRSIKDNYGIGIGKAWVILGLPYGVVVLLVVAIISAAVVGMAISLIQFFS